MHVGGTDGCRQQPRITCAIALSYTYTDKSRDVAMFSECRITRQYWIRRGILTVDQQWREMGSGEKC